MRRNIADVYRHASGSAPGHVLGVAVMTDTDNIGTSAGGRYDDIRFGYAND